MGAGQFKEATSAEIGQAVANIGAAYAVYESRIIANGIGGDVLADLEIDQLDQLYATIGVINSIHQSKLTHLFRHHRPSLLQRSLNEAKRLDKSFNSFKAKPFDCFLSHDWGKDSDGRENHARVARVFIEFIVNRGIRTWFDEEQMEGNIVKAMAKGIEDSAVVLVFITGRYQDKVNGDNTNDNCQLEFNMAQCTQTPSHMLPVLMDPHMKTLTNWFGQLKMVLGHHLYVDLTMDGDGFDQGCQHLYQRLEALLSHSSANSSPRGPLPLRILDADASAPEIVSVVAEAVPEVAEISPVAEVTPSDAAEIRHFSWLEAWINAPKDIDQQDEALQNLLQYLEPPVSSDVISFFPYEELINAMSVDGLKDSAIAVCAALIDNPDSIPHFLKIPSFTDTLLSLLKCEETCENVLILLCNLTFDLSTAENLVTVIPSLFAIPRPLPSNVFETLANLAAVPSAQRLMVDFIPEILKYIHFEPTQRLLHNLSGDINFTSALLHHKIYDLLREIDNQVALNLILSLCHHDEGLKALAVDPKWLKYLQSLGPNSVSFRLMAHLSVDYVSAFADNQESWISLWCHGLAEPRCIESALIILCNASNEKSWWPFIEVHADDIIRFGCKSTQYQGRTLIILANMLPLDSTKRIMQQLQPMLTTLSSTDDIETREIAQYIAIAIADNT
ncbi:hypothetical protein AeRB84_002642 [Aphanomyces euteiches]|nr:hypothetical protein AeRB84_002642 [Aphanomyces euteiches]